MAEERVKRGEFYERKALEARAKAETIKDSDARRTMLLVASMWEALARTAKGERSPLAATRARPARVMRPL